ncbi:MAG: hypothetical protein ACTSRA_00760 [Promethearchaeota archaeon]|nr:MAG: hypothetical protein [Helarchaeota virus Nidhogg Meg22_1012]URC17311.1 MAG: hypothetical protein [Helarchaeota virus Nidhogg Meg22_1214]
MRQISKNDLIWRLLCIKGIDNPGIKNCEIDYAFVKYLGAKNIIPTLIEGIGDDEILAAYYGKKNNNASYNVTCSICNTLVKKFIYLSAVEFKDDNDDHPKSLWGADICKKCLNNIKSVATYFGRMH